MSNQNKLFNEISFKDLRISKANVDMPEFALIIGYRIINKRNLSNNEPIADSIEKVTFTAIDSVLAQKLKSVGVSADNLKGFSVEYIADETKMKNINYDTLIGRSISLKDDCYLAPLWVARGASGSYSSLKIIINDLNVVKESN